MSTKMEKSGHEKIEDVKIRVPFKLFAIVTVSLPALSLLYCFVTAIIFRFYDVNETACKATNVIPSISAVTGITPQAYVWRICIGLHCTPRFAVGFMYYNYYKDRLHLISAQYRSLFLKLIRVNFWLYTIENSCLVAVTYISHKENYPIHEKIFVVFMFSSCFYMLSNTITYRWSRDVQMSPMEQWSYKVKKGMFILILLATAGLVISFIRHRIFCIPFAFSYFSAFEYVIAYTNMAYHVSAYYEFAGKHILVGFLQQVPAVSNGEVVNNLEPTVSSSNRRRKTDKAL